jgi:hypothetical protein
MRRCSRGSDSICRPFKTSSMLVPEGPSRMEQPGFDHWYDRLFLEGRALQVDARAKSFLPSYDPVKLVAQSAAAIVFEDE